MLYESSNWLEIPQIPTRLNHDNIYFVDSYKIFYYVNELTAFAATQIEKRQLVTSLTANGSRIIPTERIWLQFPIVSCPTASNAQMLSEHLTKPSYTDEW